jgi:hypothetical protein
MSPANSLAAPRPFEGGYGGYVIKYKPQPTPEGRFLAFAIVCFGLDTLHTLASISPDLPSFSTQAAAANAGWEAAARWADSHPLGEFARADDRALVFASVVAGEK